MTDESSDILYNVAHGLQARLCAYMCTATGRDYLEGSCHKGGVWMVPCGNDHRSTPQSMEVQGCVHGGLIPSFLLWPLAVCPPSGFLSVWLHSSSPHCINSCWVNSARSEVDLCACSISMTPHGEGFEDSAKLWIGSISAYGSRSPDEALFLFSF